VIPPGKVGDRFVAVFVTVTLVLLAAMAGLCIYLVVRVSNAEGDAHAAAITACNLSNGNRSEDVQIFGDILALPAISKPQFITPAMREVQAAALAKVNARIKVAYALRDCTALYGK